MVIYIVYDLDTGPRNLINNIKFKNCLFGTTSVVKKGMRIVVLE